MAFNPTQEQIDIVDAFVRGDNLVIEAGAGTGKTSTLKLMAEATDKRGVYIAYNKAIADDAKASFPSNVRCATAHSFAFRTHGVPMKHRLNGPRVPAWKAAKQLGINSSITFGDNELTPTNLARFALETVGNFCNSADTTIEAKHVPNVNGIERSELSPTLLPFARKAWDDFTDPQGTLKFQHDHYLKMWALSNPKLPGDFVLLDEAQDANPVIAGVVEAQDHMQKVMVGDQCQAIYGWRGAVDAMSKFDADTRLVLSQSFRFGNAVADEANKFLSLLDAPLTLKGFGNESKVDVLDVPDATLCRTNAEVVAQAIQGIEAGKKVAIVGGASAIRIFAESALKLQQGEAAYHADLVAFKTWGEVQQYVQEDEGRDLKVMVNLIDNYGAAKIMEIADTTVSEKDADIILSTAHKAKGREWNNVRIAGDFQPPKEGEDFSRPEMMLAYVAVTRAKKILDNAGLSWIDAYLIDQGMAMHA